MEDIIEHIYYEIKNSGYEKKLSAGIVVTGGGAMLKNINLLMEYMTGMDTRIGYPNEHLAPGGDDIAKPLFATSVGLVIKGFEDIEMKKRGAAETAIKTDAKKPAAPRKSFLDIISKNTFDWLLDKE